MIDYKGIETAVLVHALYHATKTFGMGRTRDRPDLGVAEVRELLAQFEGKDVFQIDWICGRPFKLTINAADCEIRGEELYDRDATDGEGSAAAVVARLRAKGGTDVRA